MAHSREQRGRSSPIDFARWIGGKPEARRAADDAEIAATVGELVRRLRTHRGVTQSELARRIGTTQAHISELERGLGANGPTIVTLARIVSELGDMAFVGTVNQLKAREADQIDEAKSKTFSLLGKVVKQWGRVGASKRTEPKLLLDNLSSTLLQAREEGDKTGVGAFQHLFSQGVLAGICLAVHTSIHGGNLDAMQIGRLTQIDIDLFRGIVSDLDKQKSEQEALSGFSESW